MIRCFIGLYIMLEAIWAMFWKPNDRTMKAQVVRLSRVIVGLALLSSKVE